MGRRTIQALVINSSNFNRFNVERIKQTKKRTNNKERGKIEKRIIIQKDIPIILAYSVKRIKAMIKNVRNNKVNITFIQEQILLHRPCYNFFPL